MSDVTDVTEFVQHLREDAEGWDKEAAKYEGWTHFSYSGVARFYRTAANLIESEHSDAYLAGFKDGVDNADREIDAVSKNRNRMNELKKMAVELGIMDVSIEEFYALVETHKRNKLGFSPNEFMGRYVGKDNA